jgi:hypothetical protein
LNIIFEDEGINNIEFTFNSRSMKKILISLKTLTEERERGGGGRGN